MELPKLPEGYYWKVKTFVDPMIGGVTRVSLKRNWHGLRYTVNSGAVCHAWRTPEPTPETLKGYVQDVATELYEVWHTTVNKVFERNFAECRNSVDGIY